MSASWEPDEGTSLASGGGPRHCRRCVGFGLLRLKGLFAYSSMSTSDMVASSEFAHSDRNDWFFPPLDVTQPCWLEDVARLLVSPRQHRQTRLSCLGVNTLSGMRS